MDKYEIFDKIGEGTYGVVHKARSKLSNQLVAIKTIKKQHFFNGIPQTTIREISSLKKISHPNIIDIQDIIIEDGNLSLVFIFYETDLKQLLQQ